MKEPEQSINIHLVFLKNAGRADYCRPGDGQYLFSFLLFSWCSTLKVLTNVEGKINVFT